VTPTPHPWPPPLNSVNTISQLHANAAAALSVSPSIVSERMIDGLEQLVELEAELLPVVDPTGTYSDQQYIRTRSFTVLAHGVIEDYIEGICLEVIDSCINSFNADDKPRTALLGLLTYASNEEVGDELRSGRWGIREALDRARKTLDWRKRHNNGIKEKDILQLLLPTGLKESDMSTAWLRSMDEFGELRGTVAHKGRPPGAPRVVDPGDVRKLMDAVLGTLCRLDSKLVMLRDE
jgi:hypothetical protein